MNCRNKEGIRGGSRKKREILLACLSALLLFAGCTDSPEAERETRRRAVKKTESAIFKKKVLYVNSYHKGYEWSDAITKGIMDTFGAKMNGRGEIDNSESKVILKITYMDTKRNKSEEFKKAAALKVRELIDSWQPDLVITSDDNAAKYLIVPYYKDTDLPFVFCGINMDASLYGFPAGNVTGMVEVFLIPQTLDILRQYSRDDKTCFLGADTLSEHKSVEFIEKEYKIDLAARFVNTFAEFKTAYLEIQNNCDMLLFFELLSVTGFDREEIVDFIEKNTKIPSGAIDSFNREYVLVTCAKKGEEQGEWAAKTALEILNGKNPADIPVVTNKKAMVYLNMAMARRLGIIFPMELIDRSTFVGENEI